MTTVGVDIDGVINDILSICVVKLNEHLKQDLTVDDITDYDLSKCYQVSQQEVHQFFIREEESILKHVQPQEKAAQALREIYQKHRVVLITARPPSQRQVTKDWLTKHGMPYHKLITVGSHDKRQACEKQQLDFFIEDRLENAIMISELGIPVLLMDAPHNRDKLLDGITRVHSWHEITEIVLAEN